MDASPMSHPPTLNAALDYAKANWQAVTNARQEIGWLMEAIIGLPANATHRLQETLSPLQWQAWQSAVARRACGESLAVILGTAPFMSEDFIVSADTLIPRPDTETLVEAVVDKIIDRCHEHAEIPELLIDVLELGVGSGAPLVMVDKRWRAAVKAFAGNPAPAWGGLHMRLVGVDSSLPALAIAQRNLQRHQIQARLHHSHWFEALSANDPNASFHVIYSNPPYLSESDPALLADGVIAEPRTALIARDHAFGEGMADIATIAEDAKPWLTRGGWILLEHGAYQGTATRAILAKCGYSSIKTLCDEGGRERVSLACWQG
jgi:release factor glutamine methyltransferase